MNRGDRVKIKQIEKQIAIMQNALVERQRHLEKVGNYAYKWEALVEEGNLLEDALGSLEMARKVGNNKG